MQLETLHMRQQRALCHDEDRAAKIFFLIKKKKEIIASITVCKVVKGDDKESGF